MRENVDVVLIEKISIDGIDDIHGLFVEIDDIESEKYFSRFSDDMFFFLTIDMDAIDVDHNSFAIDIIMFLGGLAFVFYDSF